MELSGCTAETSVVLSGHAPNPLHLLEMDQQLYKKYLGVWGRGRP